MQEIFIVSAGEYSSYHIVALFSTRQLAEEFLAEYNTGESDTFDPARIGVMELDSPISEWLSVTVWMTKEGKADVYTSRKDKNEFLGYMDDFNGKAIGFSMNVHSRQQAIKAVNEKKAFIICNNAWGNTEKTEKLLGVKAR